MAGYSPAFGWLPPGKAHLGHKQIFASVPSLPISYLQMPVPDTRPNSADQTVLNIALRPAFACLSRLPRQVWEGYRVGTGCCQPIPL